MNIKENLGIKTCWTAIVRDSETYEVKRIVPFENVILLQYKERLSELMAGLLSEAGQTGEELENKLRLFYVQLGYDDTETDETQTDLLDPEEDTFKNIASVEYEEDEIRTFDFWEDGEAIGEWREFAIYTRDEMAVVRANIQQDITGGETLTIHGSIKQN